MPRRVTILPDHSLRDADGRVYEGHPVEAKPVRPEVGEVFRDRSGKRYRVVEYRIARRGDLLHPRREGGLVRTWVSDEPSAEPLPIVRAE